jgi:CRISPR-associated protein Cmr4
MRSCLYYLHCLTPLHAGTGQGSGVIDLPIARERATGLPVVWGSSLKGVLRYELDGGGGVLDPKVHRALFGPETDAASDHAGALAVGDARLLALPVRSLSGTFAWVTSPLVLRRYARDLAAHAGDPPLPIPVVPAVADGEAVVTPSTALRATAGGEAKVILEDLDLTPRPETADAWADLIGKALFPGDGPWRSLLTDRLCILSDSVFDFLAETATEVSARIKIDEKTGTVQRGALWYEEALPAETLLWGVVAADRSRWSDHKADAGGMLAAFTDAVGEERRLQVGGKATVGRGQVRLVLAASGGTGGA